MAGTFVIAQGGGPTAVINQTVVGATLEIRRRHPGAKVLGSLHGVRGIRDGNYVDLSAVPEERLQLIAGTPSAALGSTRDKPDAAYCELVLQGLRKAGADAFIYIGGNDTSGTQQILTDADGGKIAFVHAPKTIDNDLEENDHTPGFMSAAEFVAGAFLSVDLDFRALPGIYVGIVMGRHAGFLTAAAAAWQLDPDSGPHLIYVPERPFSAAGFIDDVRATLDRHKRVVAVSEGVSTADGKALVESLVPADKLERDAHGNLKLSGSDLPAALERALAEGLPGKRARVDALGYMPRGNVGAISKVDAQEAFDAGAFAVTVAEQGGGSVALQFDGSRTVLKKVPLKDVAGKTRHMPGDFMKPDANQLSDAGMAYLRRLVPEKYKVETLRLMSGAQETPAPDSATGWFSRTIVDDRTTMLTEPFVHSFVRANIWHLRGRDADLLVDTGMGIRPLTPEIAREPDKPLLVVATHIHLDHVGSLHEFAWRAGPRQSAAQFESMDDAATYANMFHGLEGAVSRLPAPGWKSSDYTIPPAPLTRILDEGDIVDLGDRRFRVLHLPGHSPDSIALFDEADGLFFSGDAIYDAMLIDDLPDSDRTAYRSTMRRLLDLPIRIGHGGHGPSFDGKRMREIATAYLRQAGDG